MRWRDLRSPLRVATLAVLAGFVLLAVLGPLIWGTRAETIDIEALSQGASPAHPFGTDALGRDMLARTLVATRVSLLLAAAVTVIAFALGITLGAVPLLLGRRAMRWAAGTIHVLVAFPSLLLALLVIAIVGTGGQGAVLALAVAAAPHIARVTQALAARIAEADFVAAARGAGVGGPRLLVRHVLPNIASPLALQFAAGLGTALLALSALSFLGVGIQEPDYDWGALLETGMQRIYVTPAAALGPAAAIIVVSLCFNLLGDALADAFAVETPVSHRPAAPPEAVPPAPDAVGGNAVLRVDGLSVRFRTATGTVTPVRDVSLCLGPAERLGIVGESGSGKTLTMMAVADLVEPPGTVHAARIVVDGVDVAGLSPADRRRELATSMAMVFQDPLSSLNPALRVGRQVTEAAEAHLREPGHEAAGRAARWFRELRIAGAARRLRQFPHELSGGMRQRAVIAMGLMMRPRIILADEPTTALDVTVQRHVLRALHEVNRRHGTAIVLVSHDIAVVSAFAERVLVMYAGRIVEQLATADLPRAAHPYTRDLMAAVPTMHTDRAVPLVDIPGHPPAAGERHTGCSYAPRCRYATDRCRAERPALAPLRDRRLVACWHPRTAPAEGRPA